MHFAQGSTADLTASNSVDRFKRTPLEVWLVGGSDNSMSKAAFGSTKSPYGCSDSTFKRTPLGVCRLKAFVCTSSSMIDWLKDVATNSGLPAQ
jgi:hypothetical protein